MPSSFSHHPSSYRDPSGFLFYINGILYRQVNQVFKKDFDQFINGGLYQHLVDANILVPHQTINENLTASDEWYQTLQPEVILFISYPYEWCFNMLKDAALLTLRAAKEAMRFGMMLKDASAYNVQWYKGRMIFIDTLSFEIYDEQKPWIAYRQFCEHFFAPLALMHYLKASLQNLFLAHPDGVTLPLTKKLLPFKSKFHLHTYLHLHLHSRIAKGSQGKKETTGAFSKQKMTNLLQSLEDGIKTFSFSEPTGVWSGYYKEAGQRENYIDVKKQLVLQWINELPAKTVFDAGANEGEFSLLLKDKAEFIISADSDHFSINQFYNRIKQEAITNIHPLLIDLSSPSPALGMNSNERSSFVDRCKVDLVIALALVHHLAIGKNIPFDSISEMFHNLGNYLLIEFVPKEDEKVRQMLQHKKDIYSNYSEENFITAFAKRFSLLQKTRIGDSQRTLYLFKKQ
jgi:hypothetical protein